MKYIVVAFSSRQLAMQAAQAANSRGIPVSVINTPREADGSCGLSIRADYAYKAAITQLIMTTVLRTGVKAIIAMWWENGKKIVERLM